MGHNFTAFAPEDVDDAKRGEPSFDLTDWATKRRLECVGPTIVEACATVSPPWPDYVFNAARGEIVPNRFGQAAHVLEEISATDGQFDGPGQWFGTRLVTRRSLKSFFGLGDERPNEPFAANAAWAPTTSVMLRIPEVALLPRTVVRSSGHLPFVGNPELSERGLPGMRFRSSRWISESDIDSLVSAATPASTITARYLSLVIDHGMLLVQRNGFVRDQALDQLVDVAGAIAERLVGVKELNAAFSDTLPPPNHERWPGHLRPSSELVSAMVRDAGVLDLRQEDAVAFHRAFPRVPFPGVASGVLHGKLKGSGIVGRVAFTVQGGPTRGSYRTAVITTARPGASTPVGGVLVASTDQYVEVMDGLVCCWPRLRTVSGLAAVATVEAAAVTLRETGFADPVQ